MKSIFLKNLLSGKSSVNAPTPPPLIETKHDLQAPNAAQWNEIKAIEQIKLIFLTYHPLRKCSQLSIDSMQHQCL